MIADIQLSEYIGAVVNNRKNAVHILIHRATPHYISERYIPASRRDGYSENLRKIVYPACVL